MAIRLARHHRIPILNLAETDPREALRRLDAIAASLPPAPDRRLAEAQAARPAAPRDRAPDRRPGEAARPQPDTSDGDRRPDASEEETAVRQARTGGRRRSIRP
ncbi:MAG: hypothetical protein OXN81_09565 [Alphaproteobacteria bacterium]|nr:hypothetical protein [Alphaproteobacteria bacterium]